VDLFEELGLGLFRFSIVPMEPLYVPATNKCNMLRGAFGQAFRKLCCIPECRDAKSCPISAACPYKLLFEPSPPKNSNLLSKSQDIPRPFVFRAPETNQTCYNPGEAFQFELILVGRALNYLPYFAIAFRNLAEMGIGLNRAKCSLDKIEEINPHGGDSEPKIIYGGNDKYIKAAEGISAGKWIRERLLTRGMGTTRVTIRFMTPTFLRADGNIVERPEFHHVFKRLRDRISSLSSFFGPGDINIDFREIGKRAEDVRTIEVETNWLNRCRTSSKTHQRHELSGFIGEAVYEGELNEFLPWLALGEMVHVGRHAAWGNGRIEVSGEC
jgi:hypothetical protein